MENLVLFDWVSITSKIHTPADFMALIGMSDIHWEEKEKNCHGYSKGYYFNCISIHYDGSPDQGVWLEMSGQGCRAFETYGHGDYELLFNLVEANPDDMNITRLDIAFDDHSGILDLRTIIDDMTDFNYVCKSNYWEILQSSKGTTLQFGSPKSPVLIRIYDKAAERNITDGSHWVRVELQLRHDRAKQFISKRDFHIGRMFYGVIMNYLRFVVPDDNDSNKWRWELTDYWYNLTSAASAISVYEKKGVEYNLTSAKKHVFHNQGNSIAALISIYGVDGFVERVNARTSKSNPKYDKLVENYQDGLYSEEIKAEEQYFRESGRYF